MLQLELSADFDGHTINVVVQQRGVQDDGDIGWIAVAENTVVTYTSLNKDLLNLAGTDD